MRITTALLVLTLAASTASVAVPVFTLPGGGPHPVGSELVDLPFARPDLSDRQLPASATGLAERLLTAPRFTSGFSMVGLTWDLASAPDPTAGKEVPFELSVRTRQGGAWTDWTRMDADADAPDSGSADLEDDPVAALAAAAAQAVAPLTGPLTGNAPKHSPAPSPAPSPEATTEASPEPTTEPTADATTEPSTAESPSPEATPSATPTATPTATATETPTETPTEPGTDPAPDVTEAPVAPAVDTSAEVPAQPADEVPDALATRTAGTAPLWVGPSDALQVRVDRKAGTQAGSLPTGLRAMLVDPGRSAADADVGDVKAMSQAAADIAWPTIHRRKEWGANEKLRGNPRYTGELVAGFVHHTAGSNNYTPADVPKILRATYAYHVKGRGWSDIGYNFLVDKFGRIWEGRAGGVDRAVLGAHTGGFNNNTFGVAAMGNFETAKPSPELLGAIAQVFAWKFAMYGAQPGLDPLSRIKLLSVGGGTSRYRAGKKVEFMRISGHRDAGLTACPGKNLFAQLPTIRALVVTILATQSTYGPPVLVPGLPEAPEPTPPAPAPEPPPATPAPKPTPTPKATPAPTATATPTPKATTAPKPATPPKGSKPTIPDVG